MSGLRPNISREGARRHSAKLQPPKLMVCICEPELACFVVWGPSFFTRLRFDLARLRNRYIRPNPNSDSKRSNPIEASAAVSSK